MVLVVEGSSIAVYGPITRPIGRVSQDVTVPAAQLQGPLVELVRLLLA